MTTSGRLRTASRLRDDQGTALVEFSMVMVLVFLLIFGIITFGYMMSFRGSMAQSAAEGARAAATSPRPQALTRATAATAQAVAGYDQTCNSGELTCTWEVHDCSDTTAPLVDTVATPDCMTVELVYDYDANPLLPEAPVLGAVLPDTLSAKSVVELNS